MGPTAAATPKPIATPRTTSAGSMVVILRAHDDAPGGCRGRLDVDRSKAPVRAHDVRSSRPSLRVAAMSSRGRGHAGQTTKRSSPERVQRLANERQGRSLTAAVPGADDNVP